MKPLNLRPLHGLSLHISSLRTLLGLSEENHSVLTRLLTGMVLLSILQLRALRCRGDRSARITGWDPNPCSRGPVHGRAAGQEPESQGASGSSLCKGTSAPVSLGGLRPSFLQERLHTACISDKPSAHRRNQKVMPSKAPEAAELSWALLHLLSHAWMTPSLLSPMKPGTGEHT